jgi:cell division initiation protein
MKITPLEIKKQEFGKVFRGYSPNEVHSYLEMVAGELEDALKKNLELEENLSSLKDKLTNYTRIENVLQDTLMTTQKSAEEIKTVAEQKAKSITDGARVRADRILAEANERLLKIQRELADLKHQREAFVVSFRSLLDTQRALLESIVGAADRKSDYSPVKMKTDLSEDQLERVVSEFEEQLARSDRKNGGGDNNGSSSGEDN